VVVLYYKQEGGTIVDGNRSWGGGEIFLCGKIIKSLNCLLENKKVVEEGESFADSWIWRDDKQLGFSIKSAYNSFEIKVGGEDKALFEKF